MKLILPLTMTKIISFYSPKTAGASSVGLNAALLQKIIEPSLRVAFVEIAAWSSQATQFQIVPVQTWDKLTPFLNTSEWNKTLLERLKFNLGIDIYWSPVKNKMPQCTAKFAQKWLRLLTENYDLIVVDVASGSPQKWQQFWFSHSQKVVGVATPDPVSLEALKHWQASMYKTVPIHWLFNQVPTSEAKRLRQKFSTTDKAFLGTLCMDKNRFWRQCYQQQPVAVQSSSRFKKDLLSLLPQLLAS